MAPLPVPGFTLAADALSATLDQLQAMIDTADDAPRLPLYGVGAGFVVHRNGTRLSWPRACAFLAQHRATLTDSFASETQVRHARQCAEQLANAMRLSFPSAQEPAA
ncbi:MAG: hypothetical protein V4656_17165 [Pseudomonadota bacterium]